MLILSYKLQKSIYINLPLESAYKTLFDPAYKIYDETLQ